MGDRKKQVVFDVILLILHCNTFYLSFYFSGANGADMQKDPKHTFNQCTW